MLTEPLTAALEVIRVLESLGVPYLIGGSLASAFYGVPRATMDVDILADLRLEHAEPLARMLQDTFYVDVAMIREAILRRRSFNVIHLATMFKVDIFVPKDRPYEMVELARRQAESIDATLEHQIYLASPEDTILTKLEWYRLGGHVSERQWHDVLGVLRTQGENLDYDYLKLWAERLGVADLLDRALREAEIAR
jgi:hypothetical protein